ncbi:MAG: ABC transporter ATP-binding protein [Spirochaetes bacterium]|nr:ABC transporter ATP-binding protein [Spirochaetota bacterium]
MSDQGKPALIQLTDLARVFHTPGGDFAALDGIHLSVARGEFLAITGASGSGKSTLLQLVAGIDRPTAGLIEIDGRRLSDLDEEGLALWRRDSVGVVFQFFQLLPTLTVAENVLLPMDLRGAIPARDRSDAALALLKRVGVAGQARKFPAALSGGEQQRVAIARALANDPPLIVADEPTGNLDRANADGIVDLFQSLSALGKTILMVTHERRLAERADRSVALQDGRMLGAPREVAHA